MVSVDDGRLCRVVKYLVQMLFMKLKKPKFGTEDGVFDELGTICHISPSNSRERLPVCVHTIASAL